MLNSIVEEIKKQPVYIREVFLWVLVVIFFSIIGFVWFRSTEKKVVALLNPGQAVEERIFADEIKEGVESPFATISNMFGSLKANMSEIFTGMPSGDFYLSNDLDEGQKEIPPRHLPLPEDR